MFNSTDVDDADFEHNAFYQASMLTNNPDYAAAGVDMMANPSYSTSPILVPQLPNMYSVALPTGASGGAGGASDPVYQVYTTPMAPE